MSNLLVYVWHAYISEFRISLRSVKPAFPDDAHGASSGQLEDRVSGFLAKVSPTALPRRGRGAATHGTAQWRVHGVPAGRWVYGAYMGAYIWVHGGYMGAYWLYIPVGGVPSPA